MFNTLKTFVSDFEASVAQSIPRAEQPSPASTGSQQHASSPVSIRRTELSSWSEDGGPPSPGALAESALNGLRSSFRRGAKGSVDLARSSLDIARPAISRSMSATSAFVQEAMLSPTMAGVHSPALYRAHQLGEDMPSSAPVTPSGYQSPTAAELQAFPLYHLITAALSEPSTPASTAPPALPAAVDSLRADTPDHRFSLGSGGETPEPSSSATTPYNERPTLAFTLPPTAALIPLPADDPDDFPDEAPPLESPPHTARPRLSLMTEAAPIAERSVFSPDTGLSSVVAEPESSVGGVEETPRAPSTGEMDAPAETQFDMDDVAPPSATAETVLDSVLSVESPPVEPQPAEQPIPSSTPPSPPRAAEAAPSPPPTVAASLADAEPTPLPPSTASDLPAPTTDSASVEVDAPRASHEEAPLPPQAVERAPDPSADSPAEAPPPRPSLDEPQPKPSSSEASQSSPAPQRASLEAFRPPPEQTSFDRPRASIESSRRSLEATRPSIDSGRPRASIDSGRPSLESTGGAREAKQEARATGACDPLASAVDEEPMTRTEIAAAYKRLQADKVTLERVVRELTPLSGLGDLEAFEDYLKNLSMKVEVRWPPLYDRTSEV